MTKLLLVDDERIIREGIEHMLPCEELGITLTASCANAFEALDSMTDDMPDILFTDIKMPGMDGLALIERALLLNPALRCAILSGYEEFEFARRAMKLGVREYLLKPCDKVEVRTTIQRLCDEVQQMRRAVFGRQDEREESMKILSEKLISLATEEKARGVTARQVETCVRAYKGEMLLREAYIQLIARCSESAEWSLEAIRSAYSNNENLESTVAAGLTYLFSRSGRRAFVEAMLTYIQAHYADEDLTLQYLADHVVHMRADYIGREFALDTGMKLSAYLLQVRMERAKQLIAAAPEERHMYEIAQRVGLGRNPQYFSQLFRKYAGMTPKEYRNSFKVSPKN